MGSRPYYLLAMQPGPAEAEASENRDSGSLGGQYSRPLAKVATWIEDPTLSDLRGGLVRPFHTR